MSFNMKEFVLENQKLSRRLELEDKLEILHAEKDRMMLTLTPYASKTDRARFNTLCREIKRKETMLSTLQLEADVREETKYATETAASMKTTMAEMKKLERTLARTSKTADPAKFMQMQASIAEQRQRLEEMQKTLTEDEEIDDEYEQALQDAQLQHAMPQTTSVPTKKYDLPPLPN